MANLIDAGDKWAGGDTVVVQVNAGNGWGSEGHGKNQRGRCVGEQSGYDSGLGFRGGVY